MSVTSPRPPVIIIGMHRSGTSALAHALSKMGLFIGRKLDKNQEAFFFQKHNEWLLRSCGGRWDFPGCLNYLYKNTSALELVEKYLRLRLSARSCIEFLGPVRFIRYRSIFNIYEPWGWKDPRNALTLGVWLKLFPEARVIHIIRNGVDVANSLYQRHMKELKIAKEFLDNHFYLFHFPYMKNLLGESLRVMSLMEGFRLWEEYLKWAGRSAGLLDNRALKVRYEDFVRTPHSHLAKIAEFCGLAADDSVINSASSIARNDSSYKFINDESLRLFWKKVKDSPMMAEYGYDKIEKLNQ